MVFKEVGSNWEAVVKEVGSNWGIDMSNPCNKPRFSLGESVSDERGVPGLLGILPIDRRGGGLRILGAASTVGVPLPSLGCG